MRPKSASWPLAALLLWCSTPLIAAAEAAPGEPAGPPLASGQSRFLGSAYSAKQSADFAAYWNKVTPQNAGKWGRVEVARDVMEWTELDAAYHFAKRNGFVFHMHVLVWGNQQPAWIETLPPAEQLEEIEEWFRAVAVRYPRIDLLEVVNEPLHDPPSQPGKGGGNYIEALGGNGASGWDWVLNAFRMARAHFPNAKLMINDYSITNDAAATARYKALIELLDAEHLIDAIGVQGHAFATTADIPMATHSANLDSLAATGLPLYVTELDIDGPTDEAQLADYQRVFPVFWEHPAVKGITLWGYRPGLWRHVQGAYLVREDGTGRPALRWLRDYVRTGARPVRFDWFEYRGRDAVLAQPLPAGSYRNPILAGFHPDPSVTRAGDRFYLVNSTFAYFPGIPVYESADLVHWRHVGNVIERPTQLNFDGLGLSRGVFAPTIEYHDGTFYVLNTAVDNGGNFLATATNPAGPWSDPLWLPQIDGIDPSLFFDDDGKVYILNNGPPEGTPLYDGHRAIWMQEFDLRNRKPAGARKVLVNGGVDLSKKPIWIEGPHIYKREGWYVLVCAEGGTGPNHSQVALRSRDPWGPYVAFSGNPVLTQRDLAPERPAPITNAGHADLVEAPDGSWWAVFLGTRTYEGIHYNTGRETFLLPVKWRDGWPIILEQGQAIPYVARGPKFLAPHSDAPPQTGNFTWRDEFDSPTRDPEWLSVRVPRQPWADLRSRPGTLTIHPLTAGLDSLGNPSFLARRQQHLAFDASLALEPPAKGGVAAGMAAFQSENAWYFLGTRWIEGGLQLFLEKKSGKAPETIAAIRLGAAERLALRISGEARRYSFFYDVDGRGWKALKENDDGSILSTSVAGGFVGAVIGPYARAE